MRKLIRVTRLVQTANKVPPMPIRRKKETEKKEINAGALRAKEK
jgi:hypothetical protein